MTQEEKVLLLKDLCARLPYKVKVRGVFLNYNKDKDKILYEECDRELDYTDLNRYESLKPYLRPMSSMTEEEKKKLSKRYVWNIWSGQIQIHYHSYGCWDDETECPTEEYITLFEWLNAHHFDYRGLIAMGLALEAPEDMYNTKIK